MGRIGRLIITEVRLLSLTLSFLAQVCVSPVTLSFPVRDAKPRLAKLSHYTRPVPPPPSPTSQGHLWPRVFWGPGAGCGVPGTCRRRPTVCSPAVRVLGFPGLPELGTRDRPLLRILLACRTPRPRQPAPFFRQPGPRVTAGGGAGGRQQSRGERSPGSRFLPSRPSGLSFSCGQTGANFPAPPSDPARHPSDPGGAGTCGRGEVGWEVEARGPQRRKENQPPRNSYLSTPRAPRSSPRPWPSRCGECCRSNSDLRPPPSPDSLNFLEADAARKREKV